METQRALYDALITTADGYRWHAEQAAGDKTQVAAYLTLAEKAEKDAADIFKGKVIPGPDEMATDDVIEEPPEDPTEPEPTQTKPQTESASPQPSQPAKNEPDPDPVKTDTTPSASFAEPLKGTYKSFADIERDGLDIMKGKYKDRMQLIAEFMAQHKKASYWKEHGEGVMIMPDPIPIDAVSLPNPSGGDDTKKINSFFARNKGKDIVGHGHTYKMDNLKVPPGCRLFNFFVVPNAGGTFFHVDAADVLIYNVHIDGEMGNNLIFGFNIGSNAHNFHLIKSGYKNSMNTNHDSTSGIFLRGGATGVYVAGNIFDNITNKSGPKKTSRANGVWMNGGMARMPSMGAIIVNNYFGHMQSNGTLLDAEAITHQAHGEEKGMVYFIANVSEDAGKRCVKLQSGHFAAYANDMRWLTDMGPMGILYNRLAMVANHGNKDCPVIGNRVVVGGTRYWDYLFVMRESFKHWQLINSHISHNHVTIDTTSKHHKSGHILFNTATTPAYSKKPRPGSTMMGNLITGKGDAGYHYWTGDGGKNGTPTKLDNDVRIPFTRREVSVWQPK